MKSIVNKWKQLSATIRMISVILTGAIVLLGVTMGLRVWDKSKQKPRVLTALKQLAEEVSDGEYSFEPLLKVIQEGKIYQEGYVNLTSLDAEALERSGVLFEQMNLENSTISYEVEMNREEKVLSSNMEYQIAGIGILNISSYLTEEKLIVQIPQIHSSYLRMNTHNIKSQYENSLLYEILGDKMLMPESDFSISVFQQLPQGNAAEKEDVFQAFSKEYEGRLTDIWQQITVTRESEARQILINGSYEDCRVFHLSFPAEIVRWYFNYILPDSVKETWQERIVWKEEMVDMVIYMDDDNHIHRIDTTVQPEIDNICYPMGITFYLKGEEKLFDKVQIGLNIQRKTDQLGWLINIENQYDGSARKMNLTVSQTKPEEASEIRVKLAMDTATGESTVEYEINSPFLVSDGEHHIKRQNQPIKAPDGEIVDIFELDLIQFLKFSKDFNFALFR